MKKLIEHSNRVIRFPELPDILFKVYDINGYDFEENLKLPNENDEIGVYIFTQRYAVNEKVTERNRRESFDVKILHNLLYCGKTTELGERFDNHNHKDDLKGEANTICIHVCSNENEITAIEEHLLKTHNFTYNVLMNQWTVAEETISEESAPQS